MLPMSNHLLAAFRRGWHIYEYSGDVLHRAQAFLDRHEEIFKGMFRGIVLRWEVVSLRFVRPEAAVVGTLTWISGFSASGPPPGAPRDAKGRLRTRLLQVMVKEAGDWKITVYHHVDVKPGVTAPEPQ